MATDFKALFSRFFQCKQQKLHFAAHSHHPWPDLAVSMHEKYALDSLRLTDDKWSSFFGEVLPVAQKFVADVLGDTNPAQIVFATNTHEFIVRLLSCLPSNRKLRVLSSNHEFYSFKRQMLRLAEEGLIEWRRVDIHEPESFYQDFSDVAEAWQPDLVFCSHVTFDRGVFLRDLPAQMVSIKKALPDTSLVVIDGYHALGAVPCELPAGSLDNIFYLGGSYKYLAAGEGACFMRVPSDCDLRPRNTGWFADFASLESGVDVQVGYAADAQRFAGATMDLSGVFRLSGVSQLWDMMGFHGEGFDKIYSHVTQLQTYFLSEFKERKLFSKGILQGAENLSPPRKDRGSFLCFGPVDLASTLPLLKQKGVVADGRESTLRIGFGIYQSKEDVDGLLSALA